MPTQFELPDLAEKDYAALFEQLRAAIPKYASSWTDYNDSDPGITLLQLLAFVGDTTLYRINALPQELYLNFARLLAGSAYDAVAESLDTLEQDVVVDALGHTLYLGGNRVWMDPDKLSFLYAVDNWQKADSLEVQEMRTRCLTYWQTPYRAVTAEDFENLVRKVTLAVSPTDEPAQVIARAVAQFPGERVRLVLVPLVRPQMQVQTEPADESGAALCTLTASVQTGDIPINITRFDTVLQASRIFMAPRLLLGTALEIVAANAAPVRLTGQLAIAPGARPERVLTAAYEAILAWLDPVTGGPDGTGWPVGRPIADFDLIAPLAGVEGIDHSQPLSVQVSEFYGFNVGQSVLNQTSPVSGNPQTSVPMLADVTLSAVTDTWPIQVGTHCRVGRDTRLPWAQGGTS